MLRDPLEPSATSNGAGPAATAAAQRSGSLGEAVAGAAPASPGSANGVTGNGEQSTQVKVAIKVGTRS